MSWAYHKPVGNTRPFKVNFLRQEKVAEDTYSFFFDRTGEQRDFVAGQYFEIKIPHKNADERGDTRVFTMASSPTRMEYYMITTRVIQSSYKMALKNLKPGDVIQFDGPWDDLNFNESDTSPHVFLAGGIGITPYHSIVEYVIDKNIQNIPMVLFGSWSKKSDMVFDDFFRNANNHIENFSYVPTITGEENLENWDGERGRINSEMLKKYIYDINGSKYYIAGPSVMVKALKEQVLELGVDKDRIIAEEFEGY